MKPLYIFDLDGTLADIRHRRHLVEGDTKDWRGFFAACVDDRPMYGVITVLHMLQTLSDIWVWSGRSDEVREQSEKWLAGYGIKAQEFKMRKAGDHQPDEKLKAAWLADMPKHDRMRLVGIFEDRDRMVKLWRDNDIQCFQVAPGDF